MTNHFACNQYAWFTFYKRQGRDFAAELDTALGEIAAAGLDGYEPAVTAAEELTRLAPLLEKHGLTMRSLYVNSTLHEEAAVEQSLADILTIAEAARSLGVKIVVTNPSPIRWGGSAAKTDSQLEIQAAALNRLGAELQKRDLILAYHNHDIELRHAAREFHHMLVATDPATVTFCLDPHWVYRGAGDSQVALFDVIELYGDRVTELHLRQSQNGVWSEAFGPGDIDYPALVDALAQLGVRPHLVLEQSVEADSPQTMEALAAHRQGVAYAAQVFAALGEEK